MEHKQRAKMPVSQRAKQFMPFSAVKGLEVAILTQEIQAKEQPLPELADEEIYDIDMTIRALRKGMLVLVNYFDSGQYHVLKGVLAEVNAVKQTLILEEGQIPFQRIRQIKVVALNETERQFVVNQAKACLHTKE